MKETVYNAFGYKIHRFEHKAGERYVTKVLAEFDPGITKQTINQYTFSHIFLHTKGTCGVININTQRRFVQAPGWNNLDDPFDLGEYVAKFVEESELFLIPFQENLEMIPVVPNVTIFKLEQGSTTTLTKGTKLFLAAGQFVTTDEKTVDGPLQVDVTKDRTVTASTDCFGFVFQL